ncbi:MAG: sulfurtransferase TusA family protein [Bordetella sp.]|nr:MAG: sulfurtransferase TusA family protein [Bordetella sp.]
MKFDIEIDAKYLTCPLPILRAKKALFNMKSEQILKIITTDQNSIYDFQLFSKQTKNVLLIQKQLEKGVVEHYICRK